QRLEPRMTSLDSRRRWFALALIVAAQFMVVLDVAIVNVALPSIKTDLHFSEANLQWVVTAYAILFGGALLLGGRLADLLGRRRADNRPQLVVDLLHQRPGRCDRARAHAGTPPGEPRRPRPPLFRHCRRSVDHRRPDGPRVRPDPGKPAWLGHGRHDRTARGCRSADRRLHR